MKSKPVKEITGYTCNLFDDIIMFENNIEILYDANCYFHNNYVKQIKEVKLKAY